jgi:hypothetical protein
LYANACYAAAAGHEKSSHESRGKNMQSSRKTLASVLIAPIIVNILCVHIFLDLTGLPVAIFLVLANGFLAYLNRENYKSLFVVK